MTSISTLIGLDTRNPSTSASTYISHSTVNPEDYPSLSKQAKGLNQDIRIAYSEELLNKQLKEKELDRQFLERAKEFVELNDQVQTSTQLLSELSTFLGNFQTDLSQVSRHISQLQSRSKTIEGRLNARREVEKSLSPYLNSITISPQLINTIIDTRVSPDWIDAIIELDLKLGSIRGGVRVENRKNLDTTAENLRLAATSKILAHLNSLLKPYTVSLPSLSPLHASLESYKPLFDFLRRHSARQAHEFQKNYLNTMRWYFETSFRRYVRSLEGVRARSLNEWEGIASVGTGGSEASLALLNAKKRGGSMVNTTATVSAASRSAIANSKVDGDDRVSEIITAAQTNDKTFKPTPEHLFKSISLVLSHNSSTAFEFLSSFFGTHSSLPSHPTPISSPTPSAGPSTPIMKSRMVRLGSNGSFISTLSTESARPPPQTGLHSVLEGGESRVPESESGRTVTTGRGESDDKMRKNVIESMWKTVMEPALEYSFNFIHGLLTPPSPSPSPLSMLSMIRLNSYLLSPLSTLHHSPLSSHLYSIRLLLWPLLLKTLNTQIESLSKINGTPTPPSAATGLLGRVMTGTGGGGWGASVKDSTVQGVVERYAEWFGTVIEMFSTQGEEETDREDGGKELIGEEGDEENIFQPLLRLRKELDKLLIHQSKKIPDPSKQRAFLIAGYQELVQRLSAGGLSRHERVQREIAHYRELARSLQ